MAGKIPDLQAEARTGTGKGAARQTRREFYVPGIVYGGSEDPQPIKIKYNTLMRHLKAGRFMSTLFNLKVDGHEDVRVICRSVQRDVVKDLPTHVDLMRLRRTSRVKLFIPVEVIGEEECVGLTKGGVLSMVRPEVELTVTAGDIPEKITIDISQFDIGDTATISMVDLPKGATPTIDRDFVIANVSAPRGLRASEEDGEDSGEDAEEDAEAES